MINFWGDFTFFLFSLPTLPGCPRAPRSLWGAFFIFGVFLEKWSMVIENDCARPFLSSHRARGRARTPRPKGAARPAVFVGTWAKSSKGGVRPQHFSKPGSNERDVPRRFKWRRCVSGERRFDERLPGGPTADAVVDVQAGAGGESRASQPELGRTPQRLIADRLLSANLCGNLHSPDYSRERL